MNTLVGMFTCVRGDQRWMSGLLGHSPHCILRQALSLTLELSDPASVAGQLAQGTP